MKSLVQIGNLLSIAIFGMALTGGFLWKSPWGKIEFSSLDPWMLALILILLLWMRLSGKQETEFGLLGKAWRLGTERNAKILLFAGFFALCIAHAFKHLSLGTHGLDVSYVHQALFHPLTPRFQHCDVCPNQSAMGTHLTYSFLLLAPLTAFIHSDFLVFFLQALLIGGGVALLVFRGPLRDHRAFWFSAALIAICHRGLRASVVWDFREDAIAFFSLILMLIAAKRGKTALLFLGLLIAVLTKENVWAVTLAFAPAYYLSTKRAWTSVAIALISLGYGWLAFKVLIPHYIPGIEESHPLLVRYGEYGSTPSEILIHILTSPTAWFRIFWTTLTQEGVLKYLLFAVLPFIGFFWRTKEARIWLIPAIPGILMNITHQYAIQRSLQFHYELLFLPFLLWAGFEGMRSLEGKTRPILWGCMIALTLSGRWPLSEVTNHWPRLEEIRASRMLHEIPEDQITAVSFRLSAQVNHLKSLRILALPKTEELGDPTKAWEKFMKGNDRIQSALIPPAPWDASLIALDQEDAPERFVSEQLQKIGWEKIKETRGRKLAILKKSGSD